MRMTFTASTEDAAAIRDLAAAQRISISRLLRDSALGRPIPPPPPAIPEINRRIYGELARTAANLNQIAHHLNAGGTIEAGRITEQIGKLAVALRTIRAELIGARP